MTTVIIFIIFHHPLAHLELHSFPTRRSSDLPSVRNTSPRTDVRKIESTALPSGLLGIIPLSPVGPGHGAPSDSSARSRGGNAQSARKNNTLMTGKKKSTTSHTGCPASRNRFTVIATPTHKKGTENSSGVARNFASRFER